MGPDQHIRLSQLTGQIQDTIHSRFKGQTYWVVADITNHSFKADKKIHYFELVEKSEKGSVITAKIMGKSWGAGALKILDFENSTGQRFTNNLHVLVQVSVDFHPLYGLSVNLLDIDSNFMLGILEQQRNATLARLVKENDFIQKEGEFYSTLNSRLKLPAIIQRVAVISSSSSAGNEDFRHTMQHNDFGYVFQIDDYHTVVQEDNNAKLFLNKLIDVYNTGIAYDAIVITRGGGSQSDFLIFDNYNIGRAVAKFPIPVITGIGHQKNVSITDLMAHTHTKTPTKAAEFIIAHNRSFEQHILSLQRIIVIKSQQLFLGYYKELSGLKSTVTHNAKQLIAVQKEELMLTQQHIVRTSSDILAEKKQNLLLTAQKTLQRPQSIIQQENSNLQHLKANLKIFTSQYLRSRRLQLEDHHKTIKLLSPQNVLSRGYAGIIGHSFGGYETDFIISQTDIFAAAVAGSAVTNIEGFYHTVDWQSGRPAMNYFKSGQLKMDQPPSQNPEIYNRNSPIKHIANITTPLLSFVGKEDHHVDWHQSVEFYMALRRLGKKNILLMYPDEGHTIINRANQMDLNQRICEWFGYYLKDERPAEWIEKGVL